MINWWKTNIGHEESDAICSAIDRRRIGQGEISEAFEKEFARTLGVQYAVVTTSGSVALYLALMAVDVGPGDEVIIPDRTWVATAHAVMLTGAKVVLADVEKDRPVMDVQCLDALVTDRTKAILAVHLNGRAVHMDSLREFADNYSLFIIEDSCQALLSKNGSGYLGTLSDMGCFSLGLTKLISTGQGGFIVTNDINCYEKLKLLRNHGVVDQFTDTWASFGFNFKFTDIMSAMGMVQLSKIFEQAGACRRVYDYYLENISNLRTVKILTVDFDQGELPLYVEAMCEDTAYFVDYMRSNNVEVRNAPPSISYQGYVEPTVSVSNSRYFEQHAVYLPSGPGQELKDLERVVRLMEQFETKESNISGQV